MSDDMSLEDAAKVLNEHEHKKEPGRERPWGECDSSSDCISNGFVHYDLFESRAIAREYLRLDATAAQGSTVEALAELREIGGKAWDHVDDVEAELGRKPAVGPATRKVIEAFAAQLRFERMNPTMMPKAASSVGLLDDECDEFLAELETDA